MQQMPQQPAAPIPQQQGPGPGGPEVMQPQQPMINGEELQGLLFTRIGQMSDEEIGVLRAMITMENLPVLLKLLPELAILYEKIIDEAGSSGDSVTPEQSDQPAYQGETSDNPLVNPNVSRGLVGR